MLNYFDTESPKVKEFWDLHEKSNRRMTQLYWGGWALLLFIGYLNYTDKLTVHALLLVIIVGFFALGWLINIETQILHKRIDITEEAFGNDKSNQKDS